MEICLTLRLMIVAEVSCRVKWLRGYDPVNTSMQETTKGSTLPVIPSRFEIVLAGRKILLLR
jgi:hypothetical protein